MFLAVLTGLLSVPISVVECILSWYVLSGLTASQNNLTRSLFTLVCVVLVSWVERRHFSRSCTVSLSDSLAFISVYASMAYVHSIFLIEYYIRQSKTCNLAISVFDHHPLYVSGDRDSLITWESRHHPLYPRPHMSQDICLVSWQDTGLVTEIQRWLLSDVPSK